MLLLHGSCCSLVLGRTNGLLQLLARALGMGLLELSLLGLQFNLVLLVKLLVLCDLLLELRKGCQKGGLLEKLGLLVGIDLAGRDQLIEGLVWVIGDDAVNFGGIGLKMEWSAKGQRSSGKSSTYNLLVYITDAPMRKSVQLSP